MKHTTLNEIKSHGPCKPSWKVLLESLGKTEADNEPVSFKYLLDTLGIEDAIWCLRTLEYKEYCLFLADAAERVLPIFEEVLPDYSGPRAAIQAVRDYHAGKINRAELDAYAADAAADAVYAAKKAERGAQKELFIKHFCGEDE